MIKLVCLAAGMSLVALAGCSSQADQPAPPSVYEAAPPLPAAHHNNYAPLSMRHHHGVMGHMGTVSVQQALQTKGYYWGPVDGVYGPATAKAVGQFQKDLGVPVTGRVGHEEWSALGLSQ